MMRVVVIGAGVIGVSSAWYLARDGHEVQVIERRAGPALETSFANGGQISVSHAEPWANPRVFAKLLHWSGAEESPLLWRLRADRAQWRWAWQFLGECRASRTQANIHALVTLGLFSRMQLAQLRQDIGLEYAQLSRGILHLYSREDEFTAACRQAGVMRQWGCLRNPVSRDECLDIEPALADSEVSICGGTYTEADESGDAHLFTTQLAQRAQAGGVNFRFNEPVSRLLRAGEQLRGVELASGERIDADAYVLAGGSYSRALLQGIGMDIPVYPAKGYSATFALETDMRVPEVSLTDDERKLVFSRLGTRLRVAGTAEFTGYDTAVNARRCQSIVARACAWFPALRRASAIDYWAGLRPATPGNVPLIGRSGLRNLWLNTGHGTLGWTLACGSASLLADMLAARAATIDLRPYAPPRVSSVQVRG